MEYDTTLGLLNDIKGEKFVNFQFFNKMQLKAHPLVSILKKCESFGRGLGQT